MQGHYLSCHWKVCSKSSWCIPVQCPKHSIYALWTSSLSALYCCFCFGLICLFFSPRTRVSNWNCYGESVFTCLCMSKYWVVSYCIFSSLCFFVYFANDLLSLIHSSCLCMHSLVVLICFYTCIVSSSNGRLILIETAPSFQKAFKYL